MLYNWAALALAGEAGLGSVRRDCIETRIDETVKTGVHIFWMISRHIWPFGKTSSHIKKIIRKL